MPTCKLTKKALSHILLHIFCLHFLRVHHDYFFQRVFESVRAQFLPGNISRLLVIYLFNYSSSKSTFSILKMQLDVFLSTVFIGSRTIAPWTIAPQTIAPWIIARRTVAPQDNCPPDNCSPGQLPPGQLPPRTIAPQDN